MGEISNIINSLRNELEVENYVFDKAKISVVISVCNAEKHIYKCLKSLKAQTLKELEIIIELKECKDASKAIASTFAQYDNRIKVTNEANPTGEFIFYMSANECFKENYFSELYTSLKNSNTEIPSVVRKLNDRRNFKNYLAKLFGF